MLEYAVSVLVGAALMSAVVMFAVLTKYRRTIARLVIARAEAGTELNAAREQAQADLDAAVKSLRERYDERSSQVDQVMAALQEEVETSKRKCSEYFNCIEGVCKERDFWARWYHRQSSEHSQAQAHLLRSIDALSRQYEAATGKKAPVDQISRALVEHFRDGHPRLARSGRDADPGRPDFPNLSASQEPPPEGAARE